MADGTQGSWPEFRRSRVTLQETLVVLHDWLGEWLRIEVQLGGDAGRTTFEDRLEKVEPGEGRGQFLVRFEGNAATVNMNALKFDAFRITNSNGRTGWLEFNANGRQVLEIGLADADEVWARADAGSGPR